MTRLQFFIGVIGLIVCTNFLVANSCWLLFVEKGWLTQSNGEYWYFKSQAFVFPVLLWGMRDLFKKTNLFFFITFDLFLNFALLGMVVEFIADATKYYLSQYIVGLLSLFISIWQYRSKSKTFK